MATNKISVLINKDLADKCAELQAEVERLKQTLSDWIDEEEDEVGELQTEVERLTRENEAMAQECIKRLRHEYERGIRAVAEWLRETESELADEMLAELLPPSGGEGSE